MVENNRAPAEARRTQNKYNAVKCRCEIIDGWFYLEQSPQKLGRPKSPAICKSLPAASQSSRQSTAFNEKTRNRVSGVFRARHTGNGCTATAGFFAHRHLFGVQTLEICACSVISDSAWKGWAWRSLWRRSKMSMTAAAGRPDLGTTARGTVAKAFGHRHA